MDGLLSFLLMALECVVIVGLALELATSHEVDFFHFCTLGRNGVTVLDKVDRV